jgi:protein-S-isoprenylcysteine O-methyltransferase Ste14
MHRSPWTAWLTDFVLPHFSYTSSRLLDALPELGLPLVLLGIGLFIVGFAQVYWTKVRGHGLVTGGLYASRHPQYLGLAIIGLGAFVVWPRVLVRIMYVTMLFLYGLLARREEARCLERFGGAYREYRRRTGMFFSMAPAARDPVACGRPPADTGPVLALRGRGGRDPRPGMLAL